MKLPCSVVQDLLPNYIEHCTSEETNKEMEEHLKECDACRKLYEEMENPVEEAQEKELDYLKKVKQKNLKKVGIAIVATLAILLLFIMGNKYLIGNWGDWGYNFGVHAVEVKDGKIQANIYARNAAISKIKFENKGKVDELHVRTVPYSIFPLETNRVMELPLPKEGRYLILADYVVNAKGEVFTRQAYEMIENRTAYVGEAGAVSMLLSIMETNLDGNAFSLSLNTMEEPYSIHLSFQNKLNEIEKTNLRYKASIVLSCIDNCDTLYIEDAEGEFKVENKEKVKTVEALKVLMDQK